MVISRDWSELQWRIAAVGLDPIGQMGAPVYRPASMKPDDFLVLDGATAVEVDVAAYISCDVVRGGFPSWGAASRWDVAIF